MSEYINKASQAVEKAREAGFELTNESFFPGRIYPQDGKNSGYVAFIAEVKKENVPYYLYVKAYAGQTPRQAIIVPKEGTEVKKYGIGHSWRAMGKIEWHYRRQEDGDYVILSEDEVKYPSGL